MEERQFHWQLPGFRISKGFRILANSIVGSAGQELVRIVVTGSFHVVSVFPCIFIGGILMWVAPLGAYATPRHRET
jgi:hypothetical protein